MPRYDFRSPGADAGNAIQQFLVQRQMEERQRMLDASAQQQQDSVANYRDREISLREQQQQQRMAQAEQDEIQRQEEAQRQASEAQNQRGVLDMMAEATTMGPMTPERAQTMETMGWREGVPVPGVVSRALEPETPTSSGGFTLGENQQRFDDAGNLIASGRAPANAGGAPSQGSGEVNPMRAMAEMMARTGSVPPGTATQSGEIMQQLASDPELLMQYEQTRMEPIRAQAQTMLTAIDDLLTPDGVLTSGGAKMFGSLTPVWARGLNPTDDGTTANASLRQIIGQRVVDLIMEMKNQSQTGATGFGQLNEAELDIILSAATRLTGRLPENEAAQDLATLREKFNKVMLPSSNEMGNPINITPEARADAVAGAANPFRR